MGRTLLSRARVCIGCLGRYVKRLSVACILKIVTSIAAIDRGVKNTARKGKAPYRTRPGTYLQKMNSSIETLQRVIEIKYHLKRRPMQGYLIYVYIKVKLPPNLPFCADLPR